MAKHGSRPTDELIRLAIIGDATAFTELWDTHIGGLRSYLKGWMKNLDDFYIDDICSRSFEKAFRQIRSYDPNKSKFSTWLTTITHNTALDTMAQERKLLGQFISIDEGDGQSAVDKIGDDTDTPLDSIIKNEDEESTLRYIDGLPELYRDVARRRLVDGLQYKEIAEETGLELNTVRTRIRRAKALIDNMKNDEK